MGYISPDDVVWCLDAKTGAVIWKYSYPCGTPKDYPGPRATPTVDGNLVYTVSYQGQLFALDAAKGTVVWSVDYVKDFGAKLNTYGFSGSPLVDSNLLLVNPGGPGASVVALDKTTGKVVWKSGDDAAGYSSPVIFALGTQRMVVMLGAKGLFAFNLADGKPLWNTEWKTYNGRNAADPITFGDKVLISSGYASNYGAGGGCCLLKVTNSGVTEVYRNKSFCSHFSSPVLIGDALYGINGHNNEHPVLICYDPNTGDIKWEKPDVGTALIAAGNTLLVQSAKGDLIAIEATPEAYKEIGNAPVLTGKCCTAPSLANGFVYCRNPKGDVVCLDLRGQ